MSVVKLCVSWQGPAPSFERFEVAVGKRSFCFDIPRGLESYSSRLLYFDWPDEPAECSSIEVEVSDLARVRIAPVGLAGEIPIQASRVTSGVYFLHFVLLNNGFPLAHLVKR